MPVDAFIYAEPSLLNQFFCDSAITDKTLFYDILQWSNTVIQSEPSILIPSQKPAKYATEIFSLHFSRFYMLEIERRWWNNPPL